MPVPSLRAFFPGATLQTIAGHIRNAVKGRKIGEIMSLEVRGTEMIVTIAKMGTSTLRFTSVARDGGTECSLVEEKLALAHRPFRDDVTNKLTRIVLQSGGQVL